MTLGCLKPSISYAKRVKPIPTSSFENAHMNSSHSLIQPIPKRSKKMSAYDNPTSKKRLVLGLVGLIALGTGCAYLFKDIIIEYE